ncbi:MAG TPA: hypothetical protein VG389_22925 [Myxococcota bacterium]|nr:hypothetical protein [Myxococcota bacterium]
MSVPVVELDGIDVDQIPLSEDLRVIEDALDHPFVSDGVPIAPLETIVVMKLLARRTQDLADVEAIVESGADRHDLRAAVARLSPDRVAAPDRLFANVDAQR